MGSNLCYSVSLWIFFAEMRKKLRILLIFFCRRIGVFTLLLNCSLTFLLNLSAVYLIAVVSSFIFFVNSDKIEIDFLFQSSMVLSLSKVVKDGKFSSKLREQKLIRQTSRPRVRGIFDFGR